jgi:hypothetical protein
MVPIWRVQGNVSCCSAWKSVSGCILFQANDSDGSAVWPRPGHILENTTRLQLATGDRVKYVPNVSLEDPPGGS